MTCGRAPYNECNMFRTLFVGLVFSLIVFAPLDVSAQIIPCGTAENPCTACHAFGLVSNALSYLVALITLVITLVIVWAGIQIVMSKGDSGSISKAKEMLWNAVVGFAILLVAWLGVDTVLKVLVKDDAFGRPWNEISLDQCTPPELTVPVQNPGGTGGTGTTTPTTGTSTQGTPPNLQGGVPLTGVPIKPGIACNLGSNQCLVHPSIGGKLQGIGGSGWYVSEAWPPAGYSAGDPSGMHSSLCHGDGTCVDVGLSNRTPANISDFINRANANGLYAEWETSSQSEKDALIQAGVPESQILLLRPDQISAPHFSVYDCSSGAAAGSYACGRAGG